MSEVERFYLQPTQYSPNSPLPIVVYRNVLPQPHAEESATRFLEKNHWEKRGAWGFNFEHHFHPNTHECYGIIRGSTTLCLGRGKNDSAGGIHIPLKAGDVIVVPAGTTHTSLDSEGEYWFVGVYPKDAPKWRNEFGKRPLDHAALRREISAVAMPTSDPVYGANGPLVSLWAAEMVAQSNRNNRNSSWGERVAGSKL